MPLEWNLHYARWVIADGEPERSVEEDFDWFSLEFWSTNKLDKTSESARSALAVSDYKYRVIAELVFLSEEACVIDFGLRAIGPANKVSPKCKQGDYVTGEVAIGLPLCTKNAPEEILKSLRRRWHVNGIHADMTPHISHWYSPKAFVRDESRIRYESALSTASIRTHAYVLHCTKLA